MDHLAPDPWALDHRALLRLDNRRPAMEEAAAKKGDLEEMGLLDRVDHRRVLRVYILLYIFFYLFSLFFTLFSNLFNLIAIYMNLINLFNLNNYFYLIIFINFDLLGSVFFE
jgi:hypothetical protein